SPHPRPGGRRHHRGDVGAPGRARRGHQRPIVQSRGAAGRLGKEFPPMNEMHKPVTAVSAATLARLIAVVGDKNAITDKDKQVPYLVEFRALWTGHTPVVLRPGSTREVSELLKIANETSTAIIPQGGNTGLVGGQIPHNGEIVLSLNRMDKIREVDPISNTITC